MGRFLIALIVLLIPLFFITSSVFAQTEQKKNIVITKEEIVDKDYFAAGDSVVIAGTINGDAYIAAGNIIIEGRINGDLLAAGGNIDIRGEVSEDARIVGGNIVVTGSIGESLSMAGGSIHVTNSAQINQGLAAAGGSINIAGPVSEDVNLAGGQIILGNSVGGNTNTAGNLTLTPNANLNGNLTYWSSMAAQIQPGATVSGTITQNQPPTTPEAKWDKISGFLVRVGITISLIYLLSYILVGFLWIRFLPNFAARVSRVLNNNFWGSLVVGLTVLILTPLIILVLSLTLIGIPLALIILVIFLIALYFSTLVVSLALGQKVLGYFDKTISPYWALLAGLLIYWLLMFVPLIGWLIALSFTLLGLGSLFIERREFLDEVRSKELV